jgi:hypothetical protein
MGVTGIPMLVTKQCTWVLSGTIAWCECLRAVAAELPRGSVKWGSGSTRSLQPPTRRTLKSQWTTTRLPFLYILINMLIGLCGGKHLIDYAE